MCQDCPSGCFLSGSQVMAGHFVLYVFIYYLKWFLSLSLFEPGEKAQCFRACTAFTEDPS